jgi:hypothetical protein
MMGESTRLWVISALAMASAVLKLSDSSTAHALPVSHLDILLECCGRRGELVLPPAVNLSALIELAEHHGVLPQLYARMVAGEFGEITRAYEANTRRALWFTSELKRILAAFAAARIEVLPYKGPALAALIYGDVTQRSYSDLDFLIRPRDLNRAERLLGEIGYESALKLTQRQKKSYVSSGYELVFDSKLGRNLVELHWKIVPRFYSADLDIDALFQRGCCVDVDGSSVTSLSKEDSLIVLAVHGAKHLWPRLSMLCDVAGVAQLPGMDWDRVLAQACVLHVERILAVNLLLVQRLLKVETPEPALRMLDADRGAAALAEKFARDMRDGVEVDGESLSYFRTVLDLRERRVDRARIISRLVLTPSAGEWEAVELPYSLSSLYRVVRLARLARRVWPRARRN